MLAIIRFSVTHPISMIMIVLGILTAGIMSCFFIRIDSMPSMPPRSIIIAAKYPGISAAEIRETVSIPLENATASLRGLKTIESVSRNGLSLLRICLHWGFPVSEAVLQSREIIDAINQHLPARCEKPVVLRDYGDKETMSLVVIPKDDDLVRARQIVDLDLRERLQRIAGIGEIQLYGGTKRRVEVHVRNGVGDVRGFDLNSIAQWLGQANLEYPAGIVRDGNDELMVKTAALFLTLDEMESCPLVLPNNENHAYVTLSDIADVGFGTTDQESFHLYEGKSCIRLGLVKTPEESPLRVSRRVIREVARINNQYNSSINVIIEHDVSNGLRNIIRNLLLTAGVSVLVVMGVILYTYRSVAHALLLSLIIPVSLVLSIAVLYITGKTINIISLTGLAIGIGMVVDAGTVVVESLLLHRKKNGFIDHTIILQAVYSVAKSNTGSAITTCIVFLPIFFMTGLMPSLFSDIAVAIIASVIISCLLSLTALPAIVCILKKKFDRDVHDDVRIEKLINKYEIIISKTLPQRAKPILITLACILIGCVSWFILPFELFPQLSNQSTTFTLTFPAETSLQEIERFGKDLYTTMNRQSWISYVSIHGGIEPDNYTLLSDPFCTTNKLTVVCSWDKKGFEYETKRKKELAAIFDTTRCDLLYASNATCLELPADILYYPVLVQADSPDESMHCAKELTNNSGCSSIIPSVFTEQLVFKPDRNFCSQYGMDVSQLAHVVHAGIEGVETAPFYEKGVKIPVFVFSERNQLLQTQDFSQMRILINGTSVPVLTAGRVTREITETILYRYNRNDSRILEGFHYEDDSLPSEIRLLDTKKMEAEEIGHEIVIMLLGVILLLYFVLAAQFESFVVPVFLLFALPAAFSGAMVLLLIFGKTINVMSGIALVLLFGTAVNNSILLFESISTQKEKDHKIIVTACVQKFRTILVTAATTIAAILPFAFDPYTQYAQSSLAIAVIGGMVMSTILVLFVVPNILFHFFMFEREKVL